MTDSKKGNEVYVSKRFKPQEGFTLQGEHYSFNLTMNFIESVKKSWKICMYINSIFTCDRPKAFTLKTLKKGHKL